MEKMLDKKSRDFAKNMRDAMIYDDMTNEVQVGTDLYVDGHLQIASGLSVRGNNILLEANVEVRNRNLNIGSTQINSGGISTNELGITDYFECEANAYFFQNVEAQAFLQPPVLTSVQFIAVGSLPLIDNNNTLDASDKSDITLIDFDTYGTHKCRISTGNAVIILDKHFDETQIESMESIPGTAGNYITLKTTFGGLKLAVIPLHGAVYITTEYAI